MILTSLMVTPLVGALVLGLVPPASADGAPAFDDPLTSSRTQWWRDAKFGMFVHFGPYSWLLVAGAGGSYAHTPMFHTSTASGTKRRASEFSNWV